MTGWSVTPAFDRSDWRAATVAAAVVVDATLAWRIGWSPPLAAYLSLGAVLTVAAVIDARTYTMPYRLLLAFYPATIALLAVAAGTGGQWWPLGRAVIAMAAVAAFYLVLALAVGGQQMGLADVIAGGLIGLLLGWISWSAVSTGVILGWLVALVVFVIWRRRSRERRAIPAGPWLWLGALVVLLVTR